MKYHFKKVITIIALVILVSTPVAVKAVSTDDLLAQIQSLLKIVAQLKSAC